MTDADEDRWAYVANRRRVRRARLMAVSMVALVVVPLVGWFLYSLWLRFG